MNNQIDSSFLEEEKNGSLSLSNLITVFLIIGIILGFVTPKIYIASNIYYKSLEIEREKSKLLILEDEKRELELELEMYKFNNDIER
ncbi:MAG: hypothetical protein OIF32_01025 [Campylobacterales bacterium]|nr:hypothetical protein [Campylobacterales bacterium]